MSIHVLILYISACTVYCKVFLHAYPVLSLKGHDSCSFRLSFNSLEAISNIPYGGTNFSLRGTASHIFLHLFYVLPLPSVSLWALHSTGSRSAKEELFQRRNEHFVSRAVVLTF